jgi:hypothetical protein
MSAVLDQADAICQEKRDLAEWRSATIHHAFGWIHCEGGYEAIEYRHQPDNTTVSRSLGRLIYKDREHGVCMHCGREFELYHTPGSAWSFGEYVPEGPCCCSPECELEIDIECGITCTSCGVERATRKDSDGNAECTVCASRALRACVEAELRHLRDLSAGYRDTIPAPIPVDGCLDTPAADRSI